MDEKLIVVIGAGIIGLQTAISLRQAGFQVILLAKHFPGDLSIDYTSPWAGAQWRSHAAQDDLEQQQWDTDTYKHMLKIIDAEGQDTSGKPLSGLGLRKSRFYSISKNRPWYANMVLDYTDVAEKDLPSGLQHGHICSSIMINVPLYLKHLLAKARGLGVKDLKVELPSSSNLLKSLEAAKDHVIKHFEVNQISAFVNATGILARTFVPDAEIYPVRGQTITVSREAHQISTIEAPSSTDGTSIPIVYVLPRPHSGVSILGGTKDSGNWDAEPDEAITQEILLRAKEWAPELLNEKGEFDVLSVQVGHRPGRRGGARVEIENVEDFIVCHTYGHSGAGYQNSVGTANKVVGLIEQTIH